MKRLLKSTILIICLLSISPLLAQESDVFKPTVFIDPTQSGVSNLDEDLLSEQTPNVKWDVFAEKPMPTRQIRFMQRFTVTSLNTSSRQATLTDFVTGRSHSNVPLEDLLLWDESLADDQTKFRLKGLIIRKINSRQNSTYGEELIFRQGPGHESPESFRVKYFEGFWYVYKEKGAWSLVGRSSTIGREQNIDSNMFGWIETEKLQLWKQRLVLQPNQEKQAIKERSLNRDFGVAAFVNTQNSIGLYQRSDRNLLATNIFTPELQKSFNLPWTGQEMRWPILDNTESPGVFKIGLIGRPNGQGTNVVAFDPQELSGLESKVADQRENDSRIDVVFVIDRTASMAPYIEATKNALSASIRRFKASRNTFRFGLVTYTDVVEGEGAIKRHPLNYKVSSIIKKLKEVKSTPDPKNKTKKESVFKGLLAGTDLFDEPLKSTKFIVHIGDAAGKDYNEYFDALQDALIEKEISIISLQAGHKLLNGESDPAYENFHMQVRDILLSHGRNMDNMLKTSIPPRVYDTMISNTTSSGQRETKLSPDKAFTRFGSHMAFSMELNRYPVKGFVQISEEGKQLAPLLMEDYIFNKIKDINDENDILLNGIDRVKNKGIGEAQFQAGVLNGLRRAGFTQEQINTWLQERFNAMIEVSAPISTPALKYNLLEFAVFMDRNEYNNLIESLENLVDETIGGDLKRQNMANVWEQLLQNYIEPSEFDGNLETDFTLAEILRMVTGLPTAPAILESQTIQTVQDSKLFSDRDLNRFIGSVRSHLNNDLTIEKLKDYRYRFKDQVYYWIPQRFLPN